MTVSTASPIHFEQLQFFREINSLNQVSHLELVSKAFFYGSPNKLSCCESQSNTTPRSASACSHMTVVLHVMLIKFPVDGLNGLNDVTTSDFYNVLWRHNLSSALDP